MLIVQCILQYERHKTSFIFLGLERLLVGYCDDIHITDFLSVQPNSGAANLFTQCTSKRKRRKAKIKYIDIYMYILNERNNLCFKEIKTFGKQNKLRHAKDKVKSSDLDIF